jgi:hypothetical protein
MEQIRSCYWLIERKVEQTEKIRNRFEGIVDLVSDRIGNTASRRQSLVNQKCCLRAFLLRYLWDDKNASVMDLIPNNRRQAKSK